MRILVNSGLAIQAVAALSLAATSLYGSVTIAPELGGPVQLSGTAGGDIRATRFGNTSDGFCTGWIDATPNHVVTLEQPFEDLSFIVNAPSDTTLVVLGPNGTRCNDDASEDGHDPMIRGAWVAGDYRVYVGSYEEGQRIRYSLTLR